MIFFQNFFNEISVTCGPWTEVSGAKKILAKNFFYPHFRVIFSDFFDFLGVHSGRKLGGAIFWDLQSVLEGSIKKKIEKIQNLIPPPLLARSVLL